MYVAVTVPKAVTDGEAVSLVQQGVLKELYDQGIQPRAARVTVTSWGGVFDELDRRLAAARKDIAELVKTLD